MRRYNKFINRAVEKADMMLKLLGTPVSYLASSIHNMYVQWFLIMISMPDGTEEDLATILTVKGATKQEKADCLEEFRSNEQYSCLLISQADKFLPMRFLSFFFTLYSFSENRERYER